MVVVVVLGTLEDVVDFGETLVGGVPLACYICRLRGNVARDWPRQTFQSQSGGSGPTQSSSKSGQRGPRNRGRERHGRFGGMNVLYDSEGYEYSVDDYGQIYVPLDAEQTDAGVSEEGKLKETKN